MVLKTNYEFLFVGRDEGTFLENYAYDLEEDGKAEGGNLFITVEVQNNPADAESIGNEIFELMRKHFFQNLQEDPYKRFEAALKEVNKFLNNLKGEKVSNYIGNLNVLIGAVVDGTLYITQDGDAEAYLIRKKYVTVVSEGLSDESGDIFTNIASGDIELGDFVVFASARLLRYISKTDLAKVLNPGDMISSLSELKDVVSTEILGKVGMIGMTFEEVKEPVSETVSSVETSIEETLTHHVEAPKKYGRKLPKFPVKIPSINLKMPKVASGLLDTIKDLLGFRGKPVLSGGFTKDKILGVLILVILVLIFGIWFAKNSQAKREEIEALDATLNQVREQVTVAETKGQYDKKAAGIILSKAEEKAVKVLNSGYHRSKANEVLTLIQSTRDSIDNVKRVEDPKVLVDLSTKREGVNALGLLSLKDQFFSFEYNALYELVLDTVEEPITLDDKETVFLGTDFDDQDSLVFMTKTGKFIQYKDGNISFMDSSEGSFHKGVALADWGNRVYVLDSENNQVWRYPYSSTREVFGTAEEYNVDGDVKNGVDIAIDSSIYILNKDGSIEKLYGGKHEDFVVKREPFSEFDTPSKIYTDGDFNQIFILDSGLKRVFIYAKDLKTGDAVYSGQIVFPTLTDLRDLYVDKDSNKLYLLTATKVYEIDL
jgi:hypothetical protein